MKVKAGAGDGMIWANQPHLGYEAFGRKIAGSAAYLDLEAKGYDQVPTGGNGSVATHFPDTVTCCRRHIAPARLKKFLRTVWKPTLEVCRERHLQAIDLVGQARARWKPRR